MIIQVFAIIIEWMNSLPKNVLDNLETVMYDDMCHLAKFSRNPVSKEFGDGFKSLKNVFLGPFWKEWINKKIQFNESFDW